MASMEPLNHGTGCRAPSGPSGGYVEGLGTYKTAQAFRLRDDLDKATIPRLQWFKRSSFRK